MDEQTTNNIIKQKEEEDISRWEIEQLEKLTTESIKLAQSMKISKKQYKKIVAKLWICEYNEKENEELKF